MATKETTAIAKREATASERFALAVEKQYGGEVGKLTMTEYDKTLAQHLFVKIDAAFAEMNARKSGSDILVSWNNINMRKLAIDAVHRVQLGIDALIPGHLYPIAYFNGKTQQYDVDLRVGYKGELFYKMRASVKPVQDVRIELVYDTDEFTVYKKGVNCDVEGYDFRVTSPFARGELVGGFGYLCFDRAEDNVLVVLSKAEIERYRAAGKAANGNFWRDWYEQMAYKTIAHRLMDKIILDPEKINVTAMAGVEAEGFDRPQEDTPAPVMRESTPMTIEAEDVPPISTAAIGSDPQGSVPLREGAANKYEGAKARAAEGGTCAPSEDPF